MRIVFLTPNNVAGGAERVMTSLANEISTMGVEIYLIALSGKTDFYEIHDSVHNIKLNIDDEGKSGLKKYLLFPRYYSKLKETIKNIAPNVVISFLFMPNAIGVAVCKRLGIKIILSERNDPKRYGRLQKMMMRFLYRQATGFVCQSNVIMDLMKREYHVKNAVVIPNPLTPSQVTRKAENRVREIISVGRLIPQKNFELLIDAYAELPEVINYYRLVIYGDGPLRSELEEKIHSLGLEDRVLLPGVEKDALKNHNNATLFISSSDFEGYPNVLVEAMANGIPSIASDVPSGTVRQIINDGVNGYIFPVGDKNALKDRITKLISNDELRASFSSKSAKIYKELQIKNIAAEWLDYVNKINSGK